MVLALGPVNFHGIRQRYIQSDEFRGGVSDQKYQGLKRADPLIGVTLEERYTVDAVIARGGMGKVYRGFDMERNSLVLAPLRTD